MPPRGSGSKSKGKPTAKVTRNSPPLPPSSYQVRAAFPIHPDVLDALNVLWNSLKEFVVINAAGAFVAVADISDFIRGRIPNLRNYVDTLARIRENEPEVGYRVRLWFVHAQARVKPPGSLDLRQYLPSVTLEDIQVEHYLPPSTIDLESVPPLTIPIPGYNVLPIAAEPSPTHHATRKGRPIRPIRLGPREDPPEVSPTEEDDEIEILDTPSPPPPQKFKTEAATPKPMAKLTSTRHKPTSTGHKQAPQLILPIGSPEGPLTMHHLVRLRDVLKSRTLRHMCMNCITRDSLHCNFRGWGLDCEECAQSKRGHCSFKLDPRKRSTATTRFHDASKGATRYVFGLWERARSSLATASQLQVLANFQLEEARRTAFEVLEVVGHSSATQPQTALEGILLDTPESQELLDSLIEFINTSDMEDCIQESRVYSPRGLQRAFPDFEGLPSASASEEEQEEEDDSDEEEAIKLPEIQMDIDVVSPPRKLLPSPLTSSSRQDLPALSTSISMRSLRSQKSLQASSVSSSGVGSAQSEISSSSKKRKMNM